MNFKKKKKQTSLVVAKAKAISEKYHMMEKCCSILSSIDKDSEIPYYHMAMHSGGWRVGKYQITEAGIDINEIYSFIKELAKKRKLEIEHELTLLNT